MDEKIIRAINSRNDKYGYIVLNPDGRDLNSGEPFDLSVSQGKKSGYSWIDKFGKNIDVSAGTPEDIWDNGGLYTFTVDTGAKYFFSSSNAGDNQLLEIICLTIDDKGNFNQEVFEQTVNGQTKTELIPESGNLFVRFIQAINISDFGEDVIGDVYFYEDTTVTAGIPQTQTSIKGRISGMNNQTRAAIYTVPSGKVGFLIRGEAGIGKATSSTDQVDIKYISRRFSKVYNTKKDFTLMTSGTTIYKDRRSIPDPLPAKTDLLLRIDNVSGNNISVWGTFDILLIDENKLSDDYLDSIGQIRKV